MSTLAAPDRQFRFRWLTGLQTVAAALAAGMMLHDADFRNAGLLLSVAALGIVAGALKVELCARWGRLTMAFGVTYFALLAMGPSAALIVNVLAALAGLCVRWNGGLTGLRLARVSSSRLLFNVANYILSVAAAEGVLWLLAGPAPRAIDGSLAIPVLLSSGAYYLVNTAGVAAAIGWTENRPARQVWRENFAGSGAGYLATACGAVGVVYLYQRFNAGPVALLLLPPLCLVLQSYRLHMAKARADVEHMQQVNQLNHSVITSLALAVDAKDRTTHRHVHRVREYAIALAERIGMTGAELEAVKIASLLHDIGKLGIPERILCKPDKLTPEEYATIKQHVDIGARILEPVQFPWPVIPVVLTHHERWDGLGYPRGLHHEEIPLGGRVVGLVDVYDALTSDRPYRPAMSREAALEIVRKGAGSQFDPAVVDAFEQVLPATEERIRQIEEAASQQPQPPARARLAVGPAHTPLNGRQGTDAIDDEPPVSLPESTVWLVGRVLAEVPSTAVCSFLRSPDGSTLRCNHAEGVMADRWVGMLIPAGEGAVGYAVESGEPLVNCPASLDLARRVRPGEHLDLSAALVVPLKVEDRVVGALAIYHSSYDIFDAGHAAAASSLAEFALRGSADQRAGAPPREALAG